MLWEWLRQRRSGGDRAVLDCLYEDLQLPTNGHGRVTMVITITVLLLLLLPRGLGLNHIRPRRIAPASPGLDVAVRWVEGQGRAGRVTALPHRVTVTGGQGERDGVG